MAILKDTIIKGSLHTIGDVYLTRSLAGSVGTATTLTSLNTTKSIILATVTAATDISLSLDMSVGQELTVVILNNSSSSITQPIPNTGSWRSLDGTSITIPASTYAEISILRVSSSIYLISCKTV